MYWEISLSAIRAWIFSVSGNELHVSTSETEFGTITAEKRLPSSVPGVVTGGTKYWLRDEYQNVVTFDVEGSAEPVKCYFSLEIKAGALQLVKTSEDGEVSGISFHISGNGIEKDVVTGPDGTSSSFLTTAYREAGLNIGGGTGVNTANMRSYFMAAGFQDVSNQVNFQTGSGIVRGDVLITGQKGHTAMSIGNGKVVQASINEFGGTVGGQTGDQTGEEIWVTNYYNYPWGFCLRYPGGGSSTPIDHKT
mgnify:CR=1 FL=1